MRPDPPMSVTEQWWRSKLEKEASCNGNVQCLSDLRGGHSHLPVQDPEKSHWQTGMKDKASTRPRHDPHS